MPDADGPLNVVADLTSSETASEETPAVGSEAVSEVVPAPPVTFSDVPESAGRASVQLNGGVPFFDVDEFSSQSFEAYSSLDDRGRCGACAAMVGPETLPTNVRGEIGEVKPTGWKIAKYDWIDGRYLYNRCHLLAYQLTGENANVRNLITGTRFMNVQGMQPYEDKVAWYVQRTGNHVLYRVTPLFEGDDELARGVVMEARSIEDDGAGVCFCVFCYNEQPGVMIDYATGANASDGTMEQVWEDQLSKVDGDGGIPPDAELSSTESDETAELVVSPPAAEVPEDCTYVLNTNSYQFHRPDCLSIEDMSEKNKWYFTGTREEAIEQGYSPCKRC
ncbi:MAG: DNA/RNA non-specific endonuclease, partial [Eggerthellaceae bacterium]|nr:DNA/RNA non-specific endonuclease [Eggerthellaceae bacterium]